MPDETPLLSEQMFIACGYAVQDNSPFVTLQEGVVEEWAKGVAQLEAERDRLRAQLTEAQHHGALDYDDMRRFQSLYIAADHKLREAGLSGQVTPSDSVMCGPDSVLTAIGMGPPIGSAPGTIAYVPTGTCRIEGCPKCGRYKPCAWVTVHDPCRCEAEEQVRAAAAADLTAAMRRRRSDTSVLYLLVGISASAACFSFGIPWLGLALLLACIPFMVTLIKWR